MAEKSTKMRMDNKRKNPHGGYPSLMRDDGKNIIQEEEEDDFDIGLSFDIHGGDEIDPPSATVSERTYFLVWWLVPGLENWAPYPAPGLPFDPAWRRVWEQRYDKDIWPGFIHVEVMRRRGKSATGTSGGIATLVHMGKEFVVKPGTNGATEYGIESVSRAKIPLPRLGSKISGRFGLVKTDGTGVIGQGHICVTVKVGKIPVELEDTA